MLQNADIKAKNGIPIPYKQYSNTYSIFDIRLQTSSYQC